MDKNAPRLKGFLQSLFVFSLLLCLLLNFTGCNQKPQTHPSSLRISIEDDPLSLDPRRVRDLPTVTVIHMLYEGLMRSQSEGQPILALAEEVTVSPDRKSYTFQLRRSFWSDGQLVTAHDFEQTWKSLLQPNFPSPNAYQLYVIKGAQAVKEGKTAIDQVGIHAKDSSTLVVELEQPTPYFLHLLATHFFYPVHSSLREKSSDVSSLPHSKMITNGPFALENWKHHDELTAIPNPHYWDRNHVQLDRIQLIVLDNPTALQMFERGELDWAGSPLGTLSVDSLESLKSQDKLEVMPAAGVYLFRVNTEKPPFQEAKMRQAFAYALNRTDLVNHALRGNQQPACGLVPPSFIEGNPLFKDHDVALARQLFQESLEEQQLTLKNFPRVTICYSSNERAHKIAQVAQQQWKENLGIEVALQSNETKVYLDRLKNLDYQLGIGAWFADIRDPLSFLEIFKLKNNGTNNTQWENPEFISLLNQSSQSTQFSHRKQILKNAESVILNDMPVIPLFYASYNFVKDPMIKGVYFSELGYLDFKSAYWEPNDSF